MDQTLTIEQRFALTRARYEVGKMSRHALEKTTLRLLRSRMEQKNGIQHMLMADIMDTGWEDDDLDEDDLMLM